jgi:hypothetical protein
MKNGKKFSLSEILAAPADIAWLAAFRAMFGLCLLLDVIREFAGGRIATCWIRPALHFSYSGLGWIKPWPGIGMYIHFGLLGLLAILIATGFYYRIATALFFIGYSYVFLCDASLYSNGAYLTCLISAIMMFLPANRAYSLDVRTHRIAPAARVPAWMLWLVRFQIAIVYFFSGIAKLNADWLAGNPLQFWLAGSASVPVIGPLLTHAWAVWFIAYGDMLFGLFIVPLLLWSRTRLIAFFIALGFHATNSLVFGSPLPWLLVAGTVCFFDADWPARLRVFDRIAEGQHAGAALRPAPIFLIAVYAAIQILLPMRHVLIPGDVLWTDEGARFSWRSKVASRSSAAIFYVANAKDKTVRSVDPADELGAARARAMAKHPVMILQFARHLADAGFATNGVRPEVRVRALCALNGRMPRLLIDPQINLAASRSSAFGHDAWILPATNPPCGGGSASELESLDRRCRDVSRQILAFELVADETKRRGAMIDRMLNDAYAMKPDGLYYLDAASRTVFELAAKPGANEEVASMHDIDKNYERRVHLKLISDEKARGLATLLDRKQRINQRLQVVGQLRWEKEETRTQILEELQDAIMAATMTEDPAAAD